MFPWLLALYLATLLGVSLLLRARRGRPIDGREHFVAGGSLSAAVTGCSLAVTSVGGSSVVITTALVHTHGLAGVWMELSGAVGFLALGLWLARRVRRTGVTSIAELAGLRYGHRVRQAVALVVLVAELGWLALQARATAEITAPLLPGAAPWQIIAGTLVVVTAYTWLGGQRAVAYTDLVQVGVMAVGFGALAPIAAGLELGAEGLAGLRWDFPVSATFGLGDIAGFLVLAGLPHLVGSDIYAKILSARDETAAARGAYLGAALKVGFGAAIALFALAGSALVGPDQAPGAILSLLLYQVLPSAVAALVLLALVATLQSSADQILLSAVTMVGNDLWPRREIIPAATLALVSAAFVLATATPTVVGLMKVAYTVFAAGLALPVMSSVLPELRVPRGAALAAILGGGAVGSALHVASLLGHPPRGEPVLWGVAVSGVCLGAGALWARAKRKGEKEGQTK